LKSYVSSGVVLLWEHKEVGWDGLLNLVGSKMGKKRRKGKSRIQPHKVVAWRWLALGPSSRPKLPKDHQHSSPYKCHLFSPFIYLFSKQEKIKSKKNEIR